MKKILFTLGIIVFAISLFFNGYFYKKPPKIIIKEVEKKVYDFTQEPQMVEVYANYAGKTLLDLKVYEQTKNNLSEEIQQLEIKKSDLMRDFEIESSKVQLQRNKLPKIKTR